MKIIFNLILLIVILTFTSCKTNEVVTSRDHFDKNMEKEWNQYLLSIGDIVKRTNDKLILVKLKNKTIKLYIESKDRYEDFPDNIRLKVSRLTTKIDNKIFKNSEKVVKNNRFRIIDIGSSRDVESDLLDDNFRDDTLSFIGELDDGEALSFTQKDLKSKFIWPLSHINITSPYGFRNDPFLRKKVKFHHGLDLSAPFGEPVRASNSGKVIFASKNGGYGLTVMILHHSNILTLYAHLSKINVYKGQFVTKGSIIGEIGSTGKSTGPHLHFEIRKNKKSVNPIYYINKNKKRYTKK